MRRRMLIPLAACYLVVTMIGACSLNSLISLFGSEPTITPIVLNTEAATATLVKPPPPDTPAVVDADRLNFRRCAGNNCPVLRVLRRGEKLVVTSCQVIGDSIWCSATIAGITGYINASYIRFGP